MQNRVEEKSNGSLEYATFNGMCRSCGKYGHNASNCPDKNKNGEKANSNNNNNNLSGVGCIFTRKCYYCGKIRHHISKGHNKNAEGEKAKLAFDEEVQLNNKQVELASDSVACNTNHDQKFTIDGETFYEFSKEWIGDNDGGIFDEKFIRETVQRSSGMMKYTKMGKERMKIKQVDGSTKILSHNLLNFALWKN